MPLPPGARGAVFRAAMLGAVLPAVEAHAPEMILISAGFDAHARDPLANLNLTEADFAWATARLCDLADRHLRRADRLELWRADMIWARSPPRWRRMCGC